MTPEPDARLNLFFDWVRATNPFALNRVDAPGPDDVDTGGIHDAAFGRLTRLATQANQADQGLGVVLWGEGGVGKSHLLARLWRWADAGPALAIWLHNLQADAARLPRYVLRCVVSVLTRGRTRQFHGTPLYEIVRAALREAMRYAGGQNRRTPSQLAAAFDKMLDAWAARNPGRAALLDRTACRVLLHFYLSANAAHHHARDDGRARLAVDWLGGDSVDPDRAAELGLRSVPGLDAFALADDQQVKQVLFALALLARLDGKPLVLCFDQVDNLDAPQVAALSRFLHALLDASGNLLVVVSGVQATLLEFKEQGVFTTTAWDRLARERLQLTRIGREEGRCLLATRLDRALGAFSDVTDLQSLRKADTLFPLGSAWLETKLGDIPDFRPRDLISWARERWERQQERLRETAPMAWLARWAEEGSGPVVGPFDLQEAIETKVREKLAERVAVLTRWPAALPPSGDHLTALLRSVLDQCRTGDERYPVLEVVTPKSSRTGTRALCDVIVRRASGAGRETTVGVLVVVTNEAKSATAALRRPLQDPQRPDSLLLLTDARQPLRLGDQGEHYREELRQHYGGRFREVALAIEEYAALDALQAVVGMARTGDLEVMLPDGTARRIGADEVIASHHRDDRYRARPLLADLLTIPAEERADLLPLSSEAGERE